MDNDEDEEMQSSESEVEIEAEVEDPEEEEVGEDAEDDEEISDKEDELIEEEDGSDLEALSSPPPDGDEDGDEPTPQPAKLKIKLRLPMQSATTTNSPTPEGSVAKGPSRRQRSPRGSDIESEDSDEDGSVSTPGGRVLTARQAVLANVVGSSHVSLVEPPNPRKKKPLTELEMALKREETARKRKNLSEKKLEDEKAETINRLLKKQSRAKGKRNALSTAEDRQTGVALNNAADAEDEEVEEGSGTATPLMPTMYRWTSSAQSDGADGKKMVLSFSVPVTVVPIPAEDDDMAPMHVDPPQARRGPTKCNILGCKSQRKYRLVEDWQRGACSMEHLAQLKSQGRVVRLI